MRPATLIVDDSLTVRMDLGAAFEQAGFLPVLCATAAEARLALARIAFDLILLDVLLPDADGVEFMEELKSVPSTARVPIMFLSSEAEVKSRARALSTGAEEYVGKPYDLSYIIARAREIVGRRAPKGAKVSATTVVLIEDSETFREAMKEALESSGYSVVTAASGEDGLRVAAHVRPDAILIDENLPGIRGSEVVRQIRFDAALRGTPCLLLTASEDVAVELEALNAGADGFVRKDGDLAFILMRLRAILRSASTWQEVERTPSLQSPKRILAVDDSPTYLMELAAQLTEEGYDVVPARSGAEAIEMLGIQSVDCVLLDLLMPEQSGNETCRRIKSTEAWRDIPLIILTANDERSAMIDGIDAGADDYIVKSADFQVLKARVRAQIRRKQFEDEHRQIREQLLRKELETAEVRAALTERKRSEQRIADLNHVLVKRTAALEAANQELEAFSYTVSHDLRAPLRHVSGFIELFRQHAGESADEKSRHYLTTIAGAAKRMGALIDDLLMFSQMGRAEMQGTRVDLSILMSGVCASFENELRTRTLEWRIHELPTVTGDPAMLRLVLVNLLGNAVKYTGGRPDAVIEVGATEGKSEDVVFISDNGVGFDMQYASKLFGVFQRLHRDDEFEGTGIGLANVRRIINRHGGRTWAEGEIGKGATFHFSLPRPMEPNRELTMVA